MTSTEQLGSTESDTATVEPGPEVPEIRRRRRVRDVTSDTLSRLRGRIPDHWLYIAGVFAVTKLVLTATGLLVIHSNQAFLNSLAGNEELAYGDMQRATVSDHASVWMWFSWDSFIYVFLGDVPLDGNWHEFAFPLLYPLLGKAVAPALGGNVAMALLLISNVALVAALYYAYRLGELLLGDEAGGRRFTRYLVLMPTAFLLHASLTESLFLALTLAVFYYAERGRWVTAGALGFVLATSRSVGFFVAACLALVLLRDNRYRVTGRALRGYVKKGWPLVLLPAGWFSFMLFCRLQGGDWFAYTHEQERRWSITMQNPLKTVAQGLDAAGVHGTRMLFAIGAVALVLLGIRFLRPAYVLYALVMVAIPLSMGPPVYGSLLRYLVVVFPVALVLAHWARRPAVDTVLTSVLPLVQGVLFVTWINYWTHFII